MLQTTLLVTILISSALVVVLTFGQILGIVSRGKAVLTVIILAEIALAMAYFGRFVAEGELPNLVFSLIWCVLSAANVVALSITKNPE